MTWTIITHSPEYTDYDGYVHEEKTRTFECPFEVHQTVYYAFREKKPFRKERWAIQESRVVGVWATNICGVSLNNNNHITENCFDRLFAEKEDAIEFCLKKNRQLKVKIYD